MNFATDVLEAAPAGERALVEISREGARREWRFGEVARDANRVAARLAHLERGDVVMTLVGNRSEWVLTVVACFRLGLVALPCNEQLRAKDLELRLRVAEPRIVVCDERNADVLAAAGWDGETLWVPFRDVADAPAPPAAELAPDDPCLITFTSGTAGEPKAVLHGQRYLAGQMLQARHWLDARAGDLVWCTAASGWSKSARNVFIAPWLRGAAALLHDARFDPEERLELIDRERVDLLCMAPTEYRVIAKRATLRGLIDLRGAVAAGEALNPEVLGAWHEATNVWIRDGYGQTETGQLTGMPLGIPARPGSMGIPLPGVRLDVDDDELVADPATIPTFFLRYLGEDPPPADGLWRTGDRVTRDDDGFLHFVSRTDDVIISAGYRIGPFEVESALVAHDAVAEAAVVAAPDDERGSVVRAVIVLRDGYAPSDDLARDLQEHVRAITAPYKYPRIVDFAAELPKTASGKVRRAALRDAC
ncbi:MAG TPA: AMP-binding protein [Solirubrobacteraceae bacterium]|nr:AMP-binding protein [Solirubrobacteraceae bacterium]